MKNDIINQVEHLKNYTNTSLMDMQNAKVPSLYKLKTELRYSYNEHGFYHSIYSDDVLLLLCENIPFIQNQMDHVYHSKLKPLVDTNQVKPFLLFLDHKFIKWDDIVIIKDCKYSYIMVLNFENKKPDINCIMMPLNMRYETGLPIVDKNAAFVFNSKGELVDKPDNNYPYETIYIDNLDIKKEMGAITDKRQAIDIVPDRKISANSIFVFENGLLYTDTVQLDGLNIFSLPNKQFPYTSNMAYRAFYHIKGNESKDNIYTIRNREYLRKYIKNSDTLPNYIKELNTSFDFSYQRSKKYEQNTSNALNYIMKYNSALMNDVYKTRSNIDSIVYTADEMRNKVDDKGYMKLSRMYKGKLNNEFILFKNGLLFERYNEIKQENKNMLVPIGKIEDDDTFEILMFRNIDNRITEMVFPSLGDDTYTLDSTINLDECKLFTMDVEERDFNLERKQEVQYEIGFEWERISNNKVKIIPDSSFYYDKHVRFASKRQFRYSCKIAQEDCIDMVLPESFKCCNDRNNFLVFINGRRIDNSNFKVTTVKPTRPFDEVAVYVNLPVSKGEKVEVFCLPEKLTETVTEMNLELSGDICLNKSKISYNFSKDLYFVFVNGRKMNPNQMFDISQNTLRIITNTNSTRNISVLKHIDDDKVLKDLFDKNEDMLTETIRSIPPKELNKLYSVAMHESTEPNIKENEIPMKMVMYNIIRNYWMRPYINTGSEMVFDFDDELEEYDSDGNIVANSASIEDLANS